MSPSDITSILAQLARISAQIDAQDETLKRVESEVRKTNGRVTELEGHDRDQATEARVLGAAAARRKAAKDRWNGYFQPTVTGIVIVVLSALILAIGGIDKP